MEDTETWRLAPEGPGTQAQLALVLDRPEWTPAYLRDDTTADRWGQMLIDQTLTNVKTTLEQSSERR